MSCWIMKRCVTGAAVCRLVGSASSTRPCLVGIRRHTSTTSSSNRNNSSNNIHVSLWSRTKDFWKVVMTDYDSTPKGIREHKDLAMALLAHTHRKIRLENPKEENVDKLLDDAITELEERGMQELGVRATRFELQQELAPEVVNILQAFQKVDARVLLNSGNEEELDYKSNKEARTILLKEYRDTLVSMKNEDAGSSNSEMFHQRKLGALRTLLSFHGWTDMEGTDKGGEAAPVSMSSSTTATTTVDESSDDFGYISATVDPDVVHSIRNYQTQNLLRSALIRNELGHSVVALKSTIPGAGRGVFLDGKAMEGSLVAFIPGDVLPKEYLTKASASLDSYLSHDDTHQLSLRSDDILIDSRKAPYTVLSNEGSNPWAIGHVINHPPPGIIPNCRTVLLNFTEPMNLKSTGLLRYVPNTYKRHPMLVGPKLLERETIVMHGMAIMTRRDVQNEELFYDYKFDGSDNPEWYVDATYEEWADERD